jgi:hypothetical protein
MAAVVAVVDRKAHAAMLARVVVANKPPGHRAHAAHRARADRGLDGVAHLRVTSNPEVMKVVLPEVAWVSHALRARHLVDNLTRCVPASI